VHAVERLGRTARVERVPVDPGWTGPASRPFWADLIGGSGPAPATVPTAPTVAIEVSAPHDSTDVLEASGGVDLIIASLHSEHSGGHSDGNAADLVALFRGPPTAGRTHRRYRVVSRAGFHEQGTVPTLFISS
jgi:hypothetical protein